MGLFRGDGWVDRAAVKEKEKTPDATENEEQVQESAIWVDKDE